MGKNIEVSEGISFYDGPELKFLSAEFLRDKINAAFESILEYREECVTRATTVQEEGVVSFEKGWTSYKIKRSIQGSSSSLHVIQKTPSAKIDILLSSNEDTKNGLFAYSKVRSYGSQQPEKDGPRQQINDAETFYNIFSEAEKLEKLAYEK